MANISLAIMQKAKATHRRVSHGLELATGNGQRATGNCQLAIGPYINGLT